MLDLILASITFLAELNHMWDTAQSVGLNRQQTRVVLCPDDLSNDLLTGLLPLHRRSSLLALTLRPIQVHLAGVALKQPSTY